MQRAKCFLLKRAKTCSKALLLLLDWCAPCPIFNKRKHVLAKALFPKAALLYWSAPLSYSSLKLSNLSTRGCRIRHCGGRSFGRPNRRWEDNIEMNLKEVGYDTRHLMDPAQDRDQCLVYISVVMKLLVVVT